MKNLNIYRNTTSYQGINKQFEEKDYIVVPVVMMVEGVHNGSHGPLLHTAQELGKIPASWDGRPVVVNHPKDAFGNYISANIPEVLEDNAVGFVFNTQFVDNKLKAEAWINPDKLSNVDNELLTKIRAGEIIEVSVGVFSDEIPQEGDWNGEHYTAIATNHRPDHLALLSKDKGACSIEDGCGIRVNKKGENMNVNVSLVINALKYNGKESDVWRSPTLSDFGVNGNWNQLNRTEKARIASHFLVGSSTAPTFGDLKLPVVNPKTGKLNEHALRAVISGRGAQVTGISAEQRSAARRRAYRLLNSEFNAKLKIPTVLEEAKLMNIDGYATVQINAQKDYMDIVNAIRTKVNALDTENEIYLLLEVYPNEYIYENRNAETGGSKFYSQKYNVEGDDDNVQIVLDGTPVQVKRNVTYTPIVTQKSGIINNKSTKGEKSMKNKDELVSSLIANKFTQFTDAEKDWLMGLEVETLEKLQPVVQKKNPDPKPKPEPEKKPMQVNISKEQAYKALGISNPKEFEEQMRFGLGLYKSQRALAVNSILADTENVWSKEELENMPFETLQKLQKSISVNKKREGLDFSLLGNNVAEPEVNQEPEVEPLPLVGYSFDKKDEK